MEVQVRVLAWNESKFGFGFGFGFGSGGTAWARLGSGSGSGVIMGKPNKQPRIVGNRHVHVTVTDLDPPM